MKEAAAQIPTEDKENNGLTESHNISARFSPRDSGLLTTKPSTQDEAEKKVTPSSSPNLSVSGSQSIEQLRYENDRLLVALTQSRANAKKWEVELQTLRHNNLRLNAALMESMTNVEQWTQQLTKLKEENALLRKELVDAEQTSGSGDALQSQLADAKLKLQMAERLADDRNKELNAYKSKVDDLSRVEVQKQIMEKKIQTVEEENVRMKKDLIELNLELEKANSDPSVHIKRELHSLQQQLSTKLNELYVLNDCLADTLLKS
jgi:homer protein